MTIEWRPLDAGAIDHERLWASVLAACGLTGMLVLSVASAPPFACVFKAMTGFPCLTCGFTRGVLALAAADVAGALRWNPLVPLGAAGSVAYVAYAALALAAGPRRLRARLAGSEVQVLRWGAVLAAAAVWAWLIVDGR
jgi:hypothetical protein